MNQDIAFQEETEQLHKYNFSVQQHIKLQLNINQLTSIKMRTNEQNQFIQCA